MTHSRKRNLIEGQPVLVVIDIQGGESAGDEPSAIPFMPELSTTDGSCARLD